MISFKEYKQIYEEQEAEIDRQIEEAKEQLGEGSLEKSTLSQLWKKHEDADYTSDRGYGNGSNSTKHNSKAADVIYNHVAAKHGSNVADDMKKHSNLSTYVSEYGHGSDAKKAEREMASLRKKHKIEESREQIDERSDREDDEGYARTKDADDAWNKKQGHTDPIPKPSPARKREPIDIWKKKAGVDEGRMSDLDYELNAKEVSDADFKKKYSKSKDDMKKSFATPVKPAPKKPLAEDELEEGILGNIGNRIKSTYHNIQSNRQLNKGDAARNKGDKAGEESAYAKAREHGDKADAAHLTANRDFNKTDMSASQAQSKIAALKAKGMVRHDVDESEQLDEISTNAKHKYVAAARKSVGELGRQAQGAAINGDKETMLAKAKKLQQRNDTAIRTMGKADIETRKQWNSDFGKNESTEVEESVFDWKKNKSEVDWKGDKEKTTTSAEGGTVHKAREKSRNAETGGAAPKQSVGRPAGEYGSYKIDKAARDSKEHKDALSAKVRASKAEGFAARDDFKRSMNRAIMHHQLKLAGLDPKDHEAEIAKKLK